VRPDPLSLDPSWPSPVPLLDLESALEQTLFQSGLSREALLKRLVADVQKPGLLPLLWLLPRRWKLAPARLPSQLQRLAGLLERGLLSPLLLAALADDLPNLMASPGASGWADADATAQANALATAQAKARPNSLSLWRRQAIADGPLPTSLAAWLARGTQLQNQPQQQSQNQSIDQPNDQPGGRPKTSALSAGLIWGNLGLQAPSPSQQRLNRFSAQILNRLGANLLVHLHQEPGTEEPSPQEPSPWTIEGCQSARQWVELLIQQGWQIKAQLRASVASFGLGACLPNDHGWTQVPLALPMRTGLLDADGQEQQALLPHSCLEMEWSLGASTISLQYYQGTEGLCGWEALNDLDRPWQNNRHNGTVRYLGEPFQGDQLLEVLDLCDWMALVHNHQSSAMQLAYGGYGSLGFCIDTSALIQQAISARCDLFPVLLGGVWRERLMRCSHHLLEAASPSLPANRRQAAERYGQALEQLPMDAALHGAVAITEAKRRLRACQPSSSPFRLVQQWNSPAP